MRKMIKLAIGVAVLGFVGLIGLSTMSMLWAIAAPHPRHHPVAVEQVPAQVADVSEIERSVYDNFSAPAQIPRAVESNWATPAQIQVNGRVTWFDIVGSFAGVVLLVGMLGILAIVIRSMRRGGATAPSDESALVHELARRAQDLSQRMEALETILLDRTRATR